MGFFDALGGAIGGAIERAKEQKERAEAEAADMGTRKLCYVIQHTSNFAVRAGYASALVERCKQMSDYELEMTFDGAYRDKAFKACQVMMSTMENRDLAYRDDDGKFHKNY
jgi:hypothetical protein